jgi:hypothetical protein
MKFVSNLFCGMLSKTNEELSLYPRNWKVETGKYNSPLTTLPYLTT